MIDPWCNGSTADFGSACQGSNPCGSTNNPDDLALGFFILSSFLIFYLARKRKFVRYLIGIASNQAIIEYDKGITVLNIVMVSSSISASTSFPASIV